MWSQVPWNHGGNLGKRPDGPRGRGHSQISGARGPGMWRPGEFRAVDPDPDGEMKVKLEEIDGEGGGCGAMVS